MIAWLLIKVPYYKLYNRDEFDEPVLENHLRIRELHDWRDHVDSAHPVQGLGAGHRRHRAHGLRVDILQDLRPLRHPHVRGGGKHRGHHP